MPVPESFFKALSDATRLRCLLLLASEGQLCVCELVEALGLSQPLISRHLGQLRALGIVLDERRGQWVHYRLHPDLPPWARQVLKTTARDPSAAAALTEAKGRLARMSSRPSLACA